MIGILIVAHEPVASSFAAAIRHVLGKAPAQFEWLDVANDARPDEWLDQRAEIKPRNSIAARVCSSARMFAARRRAILRTN